MSAGVQPVQWRNLPAHRRWAERKFEDLIADAISTIAPSGGFEYLSEQMTPTLRKEPSLLLTARMVHVAAMAYMKGIPGSETLLKHGVDSLMGTFIDDTNGGWFSTPKTGSRKESYEHVHVMLAGASALVAFKAGASIPNAESLSMRSAKTVEKYFWDPDSNSLWESFDAEWRKPEEYRGANAHMHAVEAFLAYGDTIDNDKWHERALAIADRLINCTSRKHGWGLPEHYDLDWSPQLQYNSDDRAHPFRPFGITWGHSFEWARLLLALDASPRCASPKWLEESAIELVNRATLAWESDGAPGLPYTADWDGSPVCKARLHWPICEGIQAFAALQIKTQDPRWEGLYRRFWDFARIHFIDEHGLWLNETVTAPNQPSGIWPGRPDVYHSTGALVSPFLPLWPFVTVALGEGPGAQQQER